MGRHIIFVLAAIALAGCSGGLPQPGAGYTDSCDTAEAEVLRTTTGYRGPCWQAKAFATSGGGSQADGGGD